MENRPKILVVDDEPNNHRGYERTLEVLNLDFVKAMSGQQALAVAHKYDFFLILMDVQMPGMDGFETASLLLDHPKTSHIPVIFITAFARDETFEYKGYTSGAVDYLIKPINEEILRSKVGVFQELYQERLALEDACKVKNQIEKELRRNQDQLEEMVKERTIKLQDSIENLVKAQHQLIESEKMASLGRLVAGVAHELNTPIGICVTGASFLQEKMQALIKSYEAGNMRKQDLNSFIKTAPETTDIIMSNLERASDLISNFKLVAVDVSSEDVRSFMLVDYIGKVIESLHPEIKKAKHKVLLTGDEALEIHTNPGTISQIITNLVMNSIIHAFDPGVSGIMEISVVGEGNRVKIIYRDNGNGMEDKVVHRVFEPFYTTRRGSGGSGLGMYLLYNLVTQTLKGEVTCSSEPGKGCIFEIYFPFSH